MKPHILGRSAARAGVLAVSTAALLLGSYGMAAAAADASGEIRNAGGPDVIADRYMVVLKDGAADPGAAAVESTADGLATRYGGTVRYTYHATIKGFSVEMSEGEAKRLAANPAVSYVEPVRMARIAGEQTNPPSWGQDRVDQTDLPLNQKYGYPDTGGQGVTVYVLDTGIRFSHGDFGGRAVSGPDYVDNDNDAADCQGHGTHVAGTIGSTTYGLAKKAKLVSVRVLDCQGSGAWDGIVSGIDWVTANAAKPAVVNMSLGGSGTNSTLENAVKRSIAAGVQYSLAAGNDNTNACNFTPARVPEAITVGATANNDSRSTFSNYGSCLDIFAPGTNIVSTSNSGGSQTMSGTSMAAPHVAGAAALYLGANPSATPAQVRDALVNNGSKNKVTSPGSGSPNVLLYTGFIGGGDPPGDNDFALSLSPASGNAQPGASVTTTVATQTTNGSAQNVALSATGLPSGVTASFSPSTVTSGASSTLTLNVGASTAQGSYTVTVKGTGEVARTATYALTVGTGGGNTPPVASFTGQCYFYGTYYGYICYLDASASSDADGSIASYTWTFGDGTTGTGVAPSHRYTRAGSFVITLTVTDDQGATHSISKTATLS
ncbi:S8 family serine peptidase [Phytomonospora endophytica]|uniref:Subtilisin family serine protease n=1 Tax=Phytomonospora endophytica TaxID=714109 RepID=A0A841FK05_9ACTN|nr:S8 family serine peptidase [Phytomonospora endophytica]MBB6032969.1 subtilisin family serine protease [Phytomonospora endophytica]GIG65195.1 serine protease [Phytomonospora endophytica]